MRIAHFGTFDVENYGDLLFPLILEYRLSDICEEIVHVSPAGGPPVWEDCVSTVGFDEFLESSQEIDAVIIGGGQIVRTASTSLEVYDRGGVTAFTTYPSLWLGAAYVAVQQDVPLCWNAPGVSQTFGPVAAELLQWTASVTDYLAVRDEAGRNSLERASVSQEMAVVPDTAAEVPKLWGEEELSEAYRRIFESRGRRVPERTVVFHVNSRWVGEEPAAVACRIDNICKTANAVPILLGIGPCHGDDEVQRQISLKMDTDTLVIDRPQSLLEVTACIARSEAYFGSSLHGMIAACAFRTRWVLVASRKDGKYTGFLDHLGLSSRLVESWAEAEQQSVELFENPEDVQGEHALQSLIPVLDEHWNRLRNTLISYREDKIRGNNKQAAHKHLQRIGEDRFKDQQRLFQPLLFEKLEESHAELQSLRYDLRKESTKLRQERQKLRWTRKNLMLLRRWMWTIDEAVQKHWDSKQWRAGRAIGELQRRLLRQPKDWGAREQLDSQLQRFHYWNQEFEDSEEEPPNNS